MPELVDLRMQFLAMELGFDAVLVNTAVARASNPESMAQAFGQAVEIGRLAFESGCMQERDTAHASTPVVGVPFWHQTN